MIKIHSSELVPYLKQLSLAEIACHDKEEEITPVRNEIRRIEDIPCPPSKVSAADTYRTNRRYTNYRLLKRILNCFFLIVVLLLILGFLFEGGILGPQPLSLGFGLRFIPEIFMAVLTCVMYFRLWFSIIESLNDSIREAEHDIDVLTTLKQQWQHWTCERKKLKQLYPKLEQLEAEFNELARKREELYSRNIIPYPYRSMYPVVFLYDYCRGSNEDDITSVLNIFVLEQVRERLDEVIRALRGILLRMR